MKDNFNDKHNDRQNDKPLDRLLTNNSKPYATSGRTESRHQSMEESTKHSTYPQGSQSVLEKGLLYNIGRGVEKDHTKANECFNEAISQGDKDGYLYLALNYMLGYGVEEIDKLKAYSMCLLADGCKNQEMHQKLLKNLSSELTSDEINAATKMSNDEITQS